MKKRYWITGAATAAVAIKLLARPRDVDWQKNHGAVFHNSFSRFAEVDGIRVHYQEAGSQDATTLVLIHGFATSTLVWSKVFLRLAEEGFRVIVPDLMGHGYSDKPRRGPYTIESQAHLIAGLVKSLGLSRVDLVGSSYGGAVAAICALDNPQLVERLVLVGAVTNNKPLRLKLLRLFGSPVVGDVLSPLLIGSRRLLRRRMKRVYDRHAWVLDEKRVDARHLPLRAAATHRAIIRTVRRWDAERVSREAHLVRQPTLLVWGEDDPEVPLAEGQWLHSQIPDSRLIVLRECGHNPQEEFPEPFTEIVADFCRSGIGGEVEAVV